MKYLVTGAAGFIGSNLIDELLKQGHQVIGVDNFSTGRREFLQEALRSENFSLQELDLFQEGALAKVMDAEIHAVFHLAANADIRFGLQHPRRDLEQNTIVTWNVLEAMRLKGVKHILFSSTGSVYGEAEITPTPENAPFPIQTSLYGASKLAAEGLIAAYAEGYGIRGDIFRFVSILGPRYQHGHVLDFFAQLKNDPNHLRVLGNGLQTKSYLHVDDCIEAILKVLATPDKYDHTRTFNLGTDETVTVNDSIAVICNELGVKPKINYTGESRGWVGDNPLIFLDCKKIRSLGWAPRYGIRESVARTTSYLKENLWLLDASK